MFNIHFCQWLDFNCGPLELEVTALPTEPQPLPHQGALLQIIVTTRIPYLKGIIFNKLFLICQPRPLFDYFFIFSSQNLHKEALGFSRIQTGIIGIGEQADHLTTTVSIFPTNCYSFIGIPKSLSTAKSFCFLWLQKFWSSCSFRRSHHWGAGDNTAKRFCSKVRKNMKHHSLS